MHGFIMACTELWLKVKTLYHTEKQIWLPMAFKKNSRHTHQNPLKLSPVSERSAYSLQSVFSSQSFLLQHRTDFADSLKQFRCVHLLICNDEYSAVLKTGSK